MNVLIVLPLIIPMAFGVVSLLAHRSLLAQRVLGLIGTALLLLAGIALLEAVWVNGILVTWVGAWQAPYGITFVADLFSAILVVMVGLIGFAVVAYSLGSRVGERESFGYYPLIHFLLMGVCGAFLTGDIFNLYVWFEVLLMSSFVLLALGGERRQLQGGIIYVTLNLLSSALFLAGVGILYGVMGTLNLADLHNKIRDLADPSLVEVISMLFLTAFGIKGALFPMYFWLPASYHTPPVGVAALFIGLLTKVGVYSLIRVLTLLVGWEDPLLYNMFLILAALTMLSGVLGAIAQTDLRRNLSFLHIGQIGYMIMGLGLAGTVATFATRQLALAATIFYIVHHMVAMTNLFLISGLIYQLTGSFELSRQGGLYRRRPWLAVVFLIPGLALAGVPPLSGFFAKLSLFRAGLEGGQFVLVGIGLFVGLLTLYCVTRIWSEAFWKDPNEFPEETPSAASPSAETPSAEGLSVGGLPDLPSLSWWQVAPVVGLASLTVLIGLGSEFLFNLTLPAAEQLLDTTAYLNAVNGSVGMDLNQGN